MKAISNWLKLVCWTILTVCSLSVVWIIGVIFRTWNSPLMEYQIAVVFVLSALAFMASLLIGKIIKREQRRSTDIKEEIWSGTMWIGIATMLISFGTAFYYCNLAFDATTTLEIALNAIPMVISLAVAVIVESTIFQRNKNPKIRTPVSGGVV